MLLNHLIDAFVIAAVPVATESVVQHNRRKLINHAAFNFHRASALQFTQIGQRCQFPCAKIPYRCGNRRAFAHTRTHTHPLTLMKRDQCASAPMLALRSLWKHQKETRPPHVERLWRSCDSSCDSRHAILVITDTRPNGRARWKDPRR